MPSPDDGRSRPSAVGLAAVTAVVTLAAAVGLLPRWQGLIHLVALPPLDLVADAQLLFVRAAGVPEAVLGLAASLAIRAAVLATLLGGFTRGRWLLALRFYAVVLPLALLAAALRFASMAVLFYLLFWGGLALTLALVGLTAAAPWLAATAGLRLRTGFRVAARHGFRLGTLGAYLAALTLLGALADLGGPVAAVALVPVSALLTYGAAWFLLADPGFRVARRVVAAVPAAAVVALLVVVMTGPAGPPTTGEPDVEQDGSILLMSGIDSSSGSGAILEIDPWVILGWPCERTFHFSYAGMGDGQPQGGARCPIEVGAPYRAEDTLRSRAELVPALEAFAEVMPAPGVVAGHSQGAWLVWDAATQAKLPGVEVVVLVGAFPENRVTFPEWGERGPGSVGRYALDLVESIPRPGGTTVFEADSPLGREWLAHPEAVEAVLDRPLPDGVRALSVTSAFDLPLLHGSHRVAGAVDACPVPVMHPNLPYAPELQDVVARFVAGEDLPACPRWRTAPGLLLRHFSPPPSPGR